MCNTLNFVRQLIPWDTTHPDGKYLSLVFYTCVILTKH